ncbi:MAG TPA: type II toxin-antitoxin system prevent-host-death family antitoxin [Actinocrinis sp.]|nr:type II toxin-antitoxin system prevent-host-death family antitoxin [Actinocrinis sp.]
MTSQNSTQAANSTTSLTHARAHLRDLAYQARFQGPVTLTDNGRPIAVLVPVEALDELRRLRIEALAHEAAQDLGSEFVPHAQAMRMLGLAGAATTGAPESRAA